MPSTELSSDTAQSPGMFRREALSQRSVGSQLLWMGDNRIPPGACSANHHHGPSESGIYVVSGHPAFVFLDDGVERTVQAAPGDFIYVPAWLPHREENPSLEEAAVVVLARTTQESIAVNLESLASAT